LVPPGRPVAPRRRSSAPRRRPRNAGSIRIERDGYSAARRPRDGSPRRAALGAALALVNRWRWSRAPVCLDEENWRRTCAIGPRPVPSARSRSTRSRPPARLKAGVRDRQPPNLDVVLRRDAISILVSRSPSTLRYSPCPARTPRGSRRRARVRLWVPKIPRRIEIAHVEERAPTVARDVSRYR